MHHINQRYNSEKDSILEQQLIYEPSGKVMDIINNEDDEQDFTEIWNNLAPNAESENIPPQHIETMNETEKNSYNADIGIDLGIRSGNETGNIVLQTELNDVEYRELMRSLNKKQQAFVSNTLSTLKQSSTEQIFRFLSGGAGVGKSHVIKALHQSLIKYYDKLAGCDFNKATVLLLAPTGKAAFNIGGNTIHNALHILPNQSLVWKPLSMDKLNTFRCKYQDLKIVIIDEISMVGNKLFHYVHKRLQEITTRPLPFGGISVIAVGDLFQLRPVMDNYIFSNLKDGYGTLAVNLWVDYFSMYELTEIMRQKENKEFAELLNRLREGHHTKYDVQKLQTRISKHASLEYPHLFLTNAKVKEHNELVISQYQDEILCIAAHDTVIGDVSHDVAEKTKTNIPTDPSKTMQLYSELIVAVGMIYDISSNVDTEDGLANGATCVLRYVTKHAKATNNKLSVKQVLIVWVEFENEIIGKKIRNVYKHLYKHAINCKWTPIMSISRQFNVGRKHIEVSRQQFPLRPAAAKTVHRSQGTTVDNIVVDLSGRAFSHIHYVALSRVKSMDGLYITNLNENKINVDENVVEEMLRLRATPLDLSSKFDKSQTTVMYINCRSLHKHIRDLNSIALLREMSIVVCSETRFMYKDQTDYKLAGFDCDRFDEPTINEQRPSHGMCIYYKSGINIQVLQKIRINLTEAIAFKIEGKNDVYVAFYRSPNERGLRSLKKIMNSFTRNHIMRKNVILMGDFNMDWNCEPKNKMLSKLMEDEFHFTQLQDKVTTQQNSMLDLIFTMSKNRHSIGAEEMFFTDHKGIWIML